MRAAAVLSILLVALGAAGDARAAAGSVSLLGIGGDGGQHLAEQLERDLAELYELVPGDVYRSGAERLGRRGAAPDEVREVCTALRIDAIVAGAIGGEGATRRLVMVTREGASGEVVARARYDLSARTLPLVRERLLRDLVRALERVRRIPPRGQPLAEAAPSVEAAPPPAEEVEPQVTAAARAPRRARPYRGFSAGVGPAIMGRSLSFDVPTAPGYRRGAVAAIRADGTVFPLALSAELAEAHPVLASFGLRGSYERALGLRSSTQIADVAGTASRWSILFIGRAPLGRGGTLTIETGYQQLGWASESARDLGVPDVGYGLFDFGLVWERALGTPVATLAVRVAGEALADAGAIAAADQYGPTRGGGLELDVGLTVRPLGWLWLRAGARYTPVFLRFAPAGARFARSAVDQLVDGALEVGFAL